MKVKYIDNDGGEEMFSEERQNVTELLTILKQGNCINLRWPDGSFWYGSFSNAVLDVEIDVSGNTVECLLIYFDRIHSK